MKKWLTLCLTLLSILTSFGLLQTTSHASRAATVAYFTFTPRSGGPGTVVHITGGDYWAPSVQIYLSKVDHFKIEPLSQPMVVAQPDKNGKWTATITIPSTWSTGEPITPGVIYVVADNVDVHPFNFTLTKLPRTGHSTTPIWFAVVILGLLMVAAGSWLLVRRTRHADRFR